MRCRYSSYEEACADLSAKGQLKFFGRGGEGHEYGIYSFTKDFRTVTLLIHLQTGYVIELKPEK